MGLRQAWVPGVLIRVRGRGELGMKGKGEHECLWSRDAPARASMWEGGGREDDKAVDVNLTAISVLRIHPG